MSAITKKYRRAVNALEATCGALDRICIATGAVGAGLLASGVGFVAGLVLEGITGAAGLLDVAGVAVSRHYITKAAKHEVVRVLAIAKLNAVHGHISKAVEDCHVSDEECKLILDEVEEYRTMKEEIRHKHTLTAGGMIDEETKNGLIRRGRDQARE